MEQTNFKDFLAEIQNLNDQTIKVKCLSKGAFIDCKPLTFSNQKAVISTLSSGEGAILSILNFQRTLNNIILENTNDNTLSMGDKIPIILKMRGESMGSQIKIDGEDLDITPNIQKAEILVFPTPSPIVDQITVNLGVPSIVDENKVISYTMELLKREGNVEVGRTLGNIYTFEIVKFITSVAFGENVLEFSTLPIKDRVKVVESLPLSVNKKVISFIESFKKVENSALVIDVNGVEKTFDIDVAFFDN